MARAIRLLSLGLLGLAFAGPALADGPASWTAWSRDPTRLVFADDSVPQKAELTVSMLAPRNGVGTGMLIVAAQGPLANLHAKAEELKGPGVIPSSAVHVRYALADGSASRSRGPGYDTLAAAPPIRIAPHARTGLALQPLWITVAASGDAKAGKYTGTLTISADGLTPLKVPLALQIADWALPPVKHRSTHMDVFQSPDSVAMKYGVGMWSAEHMKLLDQTFALLAPLSVKTIYITAVRRTHLGNEQAMVQWTRDKEGRLEPDLSVVNAYLDSACRHLGPVPSVVLYCWEPPYSQGHAGNPNSLGRQHDRPILLTRKISKTGELRAISGPAWGTPESRDLWASVTRAMKKSLAARDMPDSLLFGLMGDHRPTKDAMDEIANAAPETKWAVHAHHYCLSHHGYKVGLCAAVWGIGCRPTLPEQGPSGYGWRSDYRLLLNSRYDLGTASPPAQYLTLPEKWLGARSAQGPEHPLNGTKGMGRMGADFWPVLSDQRGVTRVPLCGRYPESAWGQLSLNNCTTALLAPDRDGPAPTVRSEALRETVQTMEARICIERAMLDKQRRAQMGDELADRCQKLLDQRRRAVHDSGRDLGEFAWMELSARTYALAYEVMVAAGPATQPEESP